MKIFYFSIDIIEKLFYSSKKFRETKNKGVREMTNITAIKVDDFDSTSLSSSIRRVGAENFSENFQEGDCWVACPQQLLAKDIKKITVISRKLEDIVLIEFTNKEKIRIKKFEGESPRECIEEADSDFKHFGLDISNLNNWLVD